MNILMTGGSGFIGSHLIQKLLSIDEVKSIINIDLNESLIKHAKLITLCADIRNSRVSDLKIESRIDLCIHLAALCKEPGFVWDEYFDVNYYGTKNIVQLCEKLNINSIIFTSTMMVYRAGEVKRTEESKTAPDTAYGISKLLAEKELEIWFSNDIENRSLKIIRPAVVFGENEKANFTNLFYGIKKGFFPFVGKSNTIKANIYVKELVSFILFLKDRKTVHYIYNFAFQDEYTMKIIVNNFKRIFNLRSFNPVLPLNFLLCISYLFELLSKFGLKNNIHHRRIEKLYYSTNIFPENALKEGYKFSFNLETALEDWKNTKDLD